MTTTVDPFYDELKRHGEGALKPFDNSLRERVRERAADGCESCATLIEQFDLAFAQAFMAGSLFG